MAKGAAWRCRLGALTLIGVVMTAWADGQTDYRAGADFAKQVQGQGERTLKDFNPATAIPNYTATPPQQAYYGGVTASDDSALKNQGSQHWSKSEVGKAVNDSVLNNPKEPISPDAPFIKAAQDVEKRADSIVGKDKMACEAKTVTRSEFTNYTCERDVQVDQYCTRTASIVGDWVDSTVEQDIIIDSRKLTFTEGHYRAEVRFTVPAGMSGEIMWAKLAHNQLDFTTDMTLNVLGTWVSLNSGTRMFYPKGRISPGQKITMFTSHVGMPWMTVNFYNRHSGYFVITLHVKTGSKEFKPRIVWTENCPFDKREGKPLKQECISPGGTRSIQREGKTYSLHSDCWQYKDTYMTQPANNGTCDAYMKNPACTLATRKCAFSSEEGICLHENATFSCETRTSGKMMICGGDVFCLDGTCDKTQKGTKGNDFVQAVSELAAVAAAGKDIAAMNGIDVRAFTGQPKFCKKFAVGFSNCCTDSGWGQDLGLAHCSSEEKALAKAKTKKLTVSVGEFCSKKVLGVCVEKKRSYCQFDSILAKIVQQQGREWQLGVGFGDASGPDCLGITVEELQRINFDRLDFADFSEDLMKNQSMPNHDALLNRVRDQIADKMKRVTQ